MRDEDEDDPKKPQPVSLDRKGDNAYEAQEHGPSEVSPEARDHDERYQHTHVRC